MLMSDPDRWERRTATVTASELGVWLYHVSSEGWELVSTVPDATAGDEHALRYRVELRRSLAPHDPA